MRTRNVVLTDRQADLVERLVESGQYQNASEVLRDGLRLLERRQAEDELRLQALKDAAQVGLEDVAAGRYRRFAAPQALRKHLTSLADRKVRTRKS